MSPDRAASILARFNSAHNLFLGKLRELPPEHIEHQPPANGWTAAQIGCHVALANEWTAAVLLGSTPLARPVPPGFTERFNAGTVPWNTKTFPLDPPDVVSADNTLERLRKSGHHLSKAIASLTADRGANYCVELPWGTLSLFELAEYTVAHIGRHAAQIDRAVGRGQDASAADARPVAR
jgi:hypothetical protein